MLRQAMTNGHLASLLPEKMAPVKWGKGSGFGRPEKRFQCRLGKKIVVEYRLNNDGRNVGVLFEGRFENRCDGMIEGVQVDLFVRQLHVPVVVAVIEIIAPIMHGEKIYEPDPVIQLEML